MVMSYDLLTHIRAKAQLRLANIYDMGANDLQERLGKEVESICKPKLKGAQIILPPGRKDTDTAIEKVVRDCDGDWTEIKDLARCTVMLDDATEFDKAIILLKGYFGGGNGWSIHQARDTDPVKDKGGFSGSTIFVSSGGHKGEIQVNTPPMMYAKSIKEFQKTNGKYTVADMKARYGLVPGGLGHAMYENFRNCEHTPIGRQNMEASKLYYAYFRSSPPDGRLGIAARAAVLRLNLLRHVSTHA